MDEAPVREGDVLAGKYRIERVIGIGGMGVVVAATHMQLDQRVALKFLLPEALANKEVVARFAREARSAAKIQSEHVARVIDVGTLETGSPFMVMEYLEGRDLADVLRERGALPIEDAVGYVLQACEAIAEAHAASIVHRDLKPANLFLAGRADKRSIIKVLDFGISKSSSGKPEDASLTRTSAIMGSPLYMSPEQMVSAKQVDQRCDIWALGVILYELVTGRPPFVAEAMTEIVAQILMQQPAPPDPASVKPELWAVIQRCLEKDPAKRFQNVGELAEAIAPFAPKAQRSSVERVSRVLGTGIKLNPGLLASDPPATSQGAAAVSDALNKAPAVAMTNASWGKTDGGLEPTAPAGKGKAIGALLAVGGIAIASAAGFVVLRRPAPPPQAASLVQSAVTPEPAQLAATVAAPNVVAPTAAPAASAAPVASASEPTTSTTPTKPTVAPRSGPSHGTPAVHATPAPVASAAPAPPPPAPAPTAKNSLQMDLK
jgi:serine/threonine-protein kinase